MADTDPDFLRAQCVLFCGMLKSNVVVAEQAIDAGADINTVVWDCFAEEAEPILHEIIIELYGGLGALQETLEEKTAYIEQIAPDSVYGITAVIFAVIIADLKMLKLLLRKGGNFKDTFDHMTLLDIAAELNHQSVVDFVRSVADSESMPTLTINDFKKGEKIYLPAPATLEQILRMKIPEARNYLDTDLISTYGLHQGVVVSRDMSDKTIQVAFEDTKTGEEQRVWVSPIMLSKTSMKNKPVAAPQVEEKEKEVEATSSPYTPKFRSRQVTRRRTRTQSEAVKKHYKHLDEQYEFEQKLLEEAKAKASEFDYDAFQQRSTQVQTYLVADSDTDTDSDGYDMAVLAPDEDVEVQEQLYTVTHKGGCHCRAVRFEVYSSPDVTAWDCNCSICLMKRSTHFIVPISDFKLLTAESAASTYTFGTHTAKHMFCKTCGVVSYFYPRSNPDGIAVNVHCLDPGTVNNITIKPFDGQNWEQSYEETGICAYSKVTGGDQEWF